MSHHHVKEELNSDKDANSMMVLPQVPFQMKMETTTSSEFLPEIVVIL